MTLIDLYARISDDKEGNAVGVENQLAELLTWCETHGHTVGQVYRDDSVSATSGKTRPGFEAVLARSVHRPLAVWHTDRLARISRDMERVLDTGMTVYSVHAGDLDLSTINGRAMARIATAMATAEVETKSARARMANASRAAKGLPYWRRAPLGHTKDGHIVEAEARHIREAVAAVLEGETLGSIARRWHAEAVPTTQGAQAWNPQRIRAVLLSERIAGVLLYKGERMPVSVIEPIVSEEEFMAVQGVLNDPARGAGGGRVGTLLTRIAHCGICQDGTRMHGTSSRFNGVLEMAYRCSGHTHNRHHRERADTAVVDATILLLTSADAPSLLADTGAAVSAAAEVGTLRAELKEWEAVAGSLGAAEYIRVTAPLRARLEEAEEAARNTDRAAIFAGLVEPGAGKWASLLGLAEAWERWEALSLDRKRAVIDATWTVTLMPLKGKEPRVVLTRR